MLTGGNARRLARRQERIIKPEDKERRVDQVLRGKQKDLPEAGGLLDRT